MNLPSRLEQVRASISKALQSTPGESSLDHFTDEVLSRVRWAVVLALFLVALAQPTAGRTVIPTWGLILVFIAYNLAVEVVRRHAPGLHWYQRIAVLDLAVVGALYALGSLPSGPLFVLFLLAATCASASLSLRASVIYTVATALLMGVLAPTLPLWHANTGSSRELAAQVIIVLFVGGGMTLLTHQLAAAHDLAVRSHIAAARQTDLNRLREQFLASVTHDLRTPLATIQAGMGMLEESAAGRLSEDEVRLLSTLRRNAERLEMLINDLLALNQIESGALLLDVRRIDLRSALEEAAARVRPLLASKDQTLTLDLPAPLWTHGDARRLDQVFANILANAHLHTPAGTRIAISGMERDHEALVRIHDTGEGIPAEELETIFLHFHRLATADAGSGLGLAIARSIVALHGGRIWAESARGEGTTFFVALPSDEPAATPDASRRKGSASTNYPTNK